MIPTVLVAASVALARCLAAVRLQRWQLGAPAVMATAGILFGLAVEHSVAEALDTEIAQHVAEIILAFLLFVDATEVKGGRLWGNSPGLVARMLLLALPLGLGAAMLLGAALYPDLGWGLLLVVGCVVVPIDFAPSENIVRDRRLSSRVRSVLNVESGYNDGIVSPVFLFGLLLAGSAHSVHTPLDALTTAVSQALKAVLVGVLLGGLVAWLMQRAAQAGWTSPQSRRLAVLLTPLVAYATAVEIGGNGFVTAFVCGIAFRYVHRVIIARRIHRTSDPQRGRARTATAFSQDFGTLEDVTTLMTMTMWFVVGLAAVVAFTDGVSWQAAVFCFAALTVLRIVPVFVSLLGTSLPRRDRLLLGLLGPRGTTTIVFGLIAYNDLPLGPSADAVLLITVLCVLGSVLLHGVGADAVVGRLGTKAADRPS